MTSLTIGIAGCGLAGRGHLASFRRAGGSRAFLWDLYPEAAQSLAATQGAETLPTFNALIQHPEIDLIIIATPNQTHPGMAIEALDAGKHVLLEKPIALAAKDALAVVAAAERNNRILHTGFELRNSHFPMLVKEMIKNGELGPLISAHITHYRGHFWPQWKGCREEAGSMYLMEDCHVIDLFRWWTEDEVTTIHAVGARRNIVRHYAYPDTQFTSFVFKGGFVGHITDCHARSAAIPQGANEDAIADPSLGHQYEYSLVGERGALYMNALTGKCHLYRHAPKENGSTVQELVRTIDFPNYGEAMHNGDGQMVELLAYLAGERPPLIEPRDALQTHLVCYAAAEALASGSPSLPETAYSRFDPITH